MLYCKLMRGLGPSVAAVVLFSGSTAAGSVIYVNAAAPNGGNGTEWAEAFNDLHDGLDAAQAGDQIWVVAGTYTPAPPNGDRSISFELASGVALYGGFVGDEDDLDQRDWIANETILSGDLNGNDEPGFLNMGENSWHVVWGESLAVNPTIDGFIICGGNTYGSGGYSRGGGLAVYDSDPIIRNCTFRHNKASLGGGAVIFEGDPIISNCAFVANLATNKGGGLRLSYCGVMTLEGCIFANNAADGGGGALYVVDLPYAGMAALLALSDCTFIGNSAHGGGAILVDDVDQMTVTRCQIIANSGDSAGGMFVKPDQLTVVDSSFIANECTMFGGGIAQLGPALFVNCVFSNNSAGLGGGIYSSCDLEVINCSFSNNIGHAIVTDEPDEVDFHFIANSVFWGNTPEQVVYDPDVPLPDTLPTICYSDIQGGWDGPGWNNIDADPLFVQPGADNLRLSFGSPCLDAGDNSEVPDWVQTDLDGNPRIINGIVDMGAYEGEYEDLPPADVDYDIDQGDYSLLVPDADEFDPEEASAVVLVNTTGPDGATALVVQHDDDLHPNAAGFSELGNILAEETSLESGQFRATMYVAFESADLSGADPLTLDLTCFNETTGNWALAVCANTQNSPGYDLPIGDRHVAVAPDGWGTNGEMGDYGVFWDPAAESGFVWANVDYAGDFAVGTALCPPDCNQPPNSLVAIEDILFVLDGWDRTDGPFDVNADGVVNIDDVFAILAAWGACP